MMKLIILLSVFCGVMGAMDSATKRNASLLVSMEQDNLKQLQRELETVRAKVDLASSKFIQETDMSESVEKSQRLAGLQKIVDSGYERIKAINEKIQKKQQFIQEHQLYKNKNDFHLVYSVEHDSDSLDGSGLQEAESINPHDGVKVVETKKSKRKKCTIL